MKILSVFVFSLKLTPSVSNKLNLEIRFSSIFLLMYRINAVNSITLYFILLNKAVYNTVIPRKTQYIFYLMENFSWFIWETHFNELRLPYHLL